MAIEIRELKIKGFIDRKEENKRNSSLSDQELIKLKRSILKECKAEIKKALSRQKRR